MNKHIFLALLLCTLFPVYGQTKAELIDENSKLKAEVQQLRAQLDESNNRLAELKTRINIAERVLHESNLDNTAKTYTEKFSTTVPVPINSTSSSINDESAAGAKAVQNQEQCKAITQAGSRCSRKAEAGSDYCWQHKPKTSTSTSTTSTSSSGRTIYTGPRGGKYYINSNGNKTYIKR
jgi:colicin import membrane protein